MSSCIKLTSMFSVISEDDQSSFSPSVLSPIDLSIEEFPTLGSLMEKVKKNKNNPVTIEDSVIKSARERILTNKKMLSEDVTNKKMLSDDVTNVSEENAARTLSFSQLSNTTDASTRLKATKPCSNVTTRQSDGSFGVCYRTHCTFAHSIEELSDPMCSFDENCRSFCVTH